MALSVLHLPDAERGRPARAALRKLFDKNHDDGPEHFRPADYGLRAYRPPEPEAYAGAGYSETAMAAVIDNMERDLYGRSSKALPAFPHLPSPPASPRRERRERSLPPLPERESPLEQPSEQSPPPPPPRTPPPETSQPAEADPYDPWSAIAPAPRPSPHSSPSAPRRRSPVTPTTAPRRRSRVNYYAPFSSPTSPTSPLADIEFAPADYGMSPAPRQAGESREHAVASMIDSMERDLYGAVSVPVPNRQRRDRDRRERERRRAVRRLESSVDRPPAYTSRALEPPPYDAVAPVPIPRSAEDGEEPVAYDPALLRRSAVLG